ncbi:MAG: choice-of-anchor B family protein [Phycisphaerales bacterium]|nr:choice-of-anchor B family protein [Phycisphaerales bacterium]
MQLSCMQKACGIVLLATTVITTANLVTGHQDDPKVRDFKGRYEGKGYKAGESARALGSFDSENVTLKSWITLADIQAAGFGTHSSANDCWGYTSPSENKYAIMGLSDGTLFVNITNPTSPQIIEMIPSCNSLWRDIKVYQDHAYMVSECGNGIQVVDMSSIDSGIVNLVGTTTTGGTTATHNVAICVETGFLYRCGGSSNGLRIYSLANPSSPAYIGDWTTRYVHDAQIKVMETGPYAGREMAFLCGGMNGGFAQTGLTVLDVTDKANLVELAHYEYPTAAYSHQGWLSVDEQYFYLGDELDESDFGIATATHIIDVSDLTNPFQAGLIPNSSSAIDHNLYTKDNLIYEANYRSGLRVFDATDPLSPVEVAYFDTYPGSDSAQFNGLWSSYPYFDNGLVIGSDLERGLFVWDISFDRLDFGGVLPDQIDPSGESVAIEITELGGAQLDTSSGKLFYNDGSGWEVSALSPSRSTGVFLLSGAFGATECGSLVSYYFEADSTSGTTYRWPSAAPSSTYDAISAKDSTTTLDCFEVDLGWSVENTSGLVDGGWERAIPAGGGDRGDPASAHCGSFCFVTDNADGNSDVDGSYTIATSPAMDSSGAQVVLSYYHWLSNTVGDSAGEDPMTVEISDDDGVSWQVLEVIGPDGPEASGGWLNSSFNLHEIPGFALNDVFRIRFEVGDIGAGSVVEAGFDDIKIDVLICDDGPVCVGDFNGDNQVNISDFSSFLVVFGTTCSGCVEDIDGSGVIDIADFSAFLVVFGTSCP